MEMQCCMFSLVWFAVIREPISHLTDFNNISRDLNTLLISAERFKLI